MFFYKTIIKKIDFVELISRFIDLYIQLFSYWNF